MKKSVFLTATLLVGFSSAFAQMADAADSARAISRKEASAIRMKGVPAKAGVTLPEIITDVEGTKIDYLESYEGYFYFMGIIPARDFFTDTPTHMVFSEDGKAYIYNIIPNFPTESYVVGTVADNKITVTFPQAVKIEKRDGSIYDYYVDRLELEMVSGEEGTFWPSEKRDVVYTMREDGSVEMEKSGGAWAVGITNNEGLWQGYADWDCVYVRNGNELLTPPEGLAVEEMQMITNFTGYQIGVGFDGDDVYMRGICPSLPDSWIKGKLEGGKVTFANGQYIGDVPGYNMMGFFFGGMAYPDSKYVWAYELSDSFVMQYDAAAKTFTTDQTIIINDNKEVLRYMYTFRTPMMHPGKEDHSKVPQNISPISYNPYGISGNCIGFKFYLPNLSVDNYILPKDELYWSLYIDDELYVFEPYLFEGLKEDMEEVPFNCDLEDIENPGGDVLHTIYIPIEDFEKVGYISLRKVAGEEDPYYSQLVEFYNPEHTGVGEMQEEGQAAERIIGLDGIQTDRPVKGRVYIVDKGTKTIKRVY